MDYLICLNVLRGDLDLRLESWGQISGKYIENEVAGKKFNSKENNKLYKKGNNIQPIIM